MHEVPAGFINVSSRMEERDSRVSCKSKERDFPQTRRWLHWELNIWTVNMGMRQRESSLCPSCCLHNSLYLDFKPLFSPVTMSWITLPLVALRPLPCALTLLVSLA